MAARTVPTMPDWTLNQEITSSLLNQITTYNRFWANRPMFRMYQAVAQSIPTGADTQMTMDTVDYDTDSGRAGSSPWSYVIPVGMTGRWRYTILYSSLANATGARQPKLYKNGALVTGGYTGAQASPATAGHGAQLVITLACNAGDVMGAYAWQNSGGPLNTIVGVQCSVFEGVLESLASP